MLKEIGETYIHTYTILFDLMYVCMYACMNVFLKISSKLLSCVGVKFAHPVYDARKYEKQLSSDGK